MKNGEGGVYMILEFIPLTQLLLACETEIPDEVGYETDNLFTSINEYNFSETEQVEFEKLTRINPPHVQKVNGKMQVIDGKYRLELLKDMSDNLHIDYSKKCIPCFVEYLDAYNTDVLKAVK